MRVVARGQPALPRACGEPEVDEMLQREQDRLVAVRTQRLHRVDAIARNAFDDADRRALRHVPVIEHIHDMPQHRLLVVDKVGLDAQHRVGQIGGVVTVDAVERVDEAVVGGDVHKVVFGVHRGHTLLVAA